MRTRPPITALSRRKPKNFGQKQNKVKAIAKQPVPVENLGKKVANNTNTPRGGSVSAKGKIPPFNPNTVKPGRIPSVNPKTVKSNTRQVKKQVLGKKTNRPRTKRLKPMARSILYAIRLLIVGVGIGAIVGTMLSVLDPASRITTAESQSIPAIEQAQQQSTPTPQPTATGLFLSQENIPLKTTIQNLAGSNPNLVPGVFFVELESGSYVDLNASSAFPAASTIKIPILIAFFQDVDAGKIRLDETLTIGRDMVAGGSGVLQYQPVGTQLTAQEVANKMMAVSDNTAANMLISRLGGIQALNERFRSWGLTTTAIRNLLPDLQGTNSTTPKELGSLIALASKGNLVSLSSGDRMLSIMRHTVRNQMLPSGLGSGATIAHKTGDINTMLADVGLVELPTGKRYIIAVMVQRPNNDSRAEKLISSISRVTYQQFNPTATAPNATSGVTYQQFSPTAPVPNATKTSVPTTSYQSPVMNPPLPNAVGNTLPMTGYPAPIMNPPLPNAVGNTLPMTGYPAPIINPPLPNAAGSTLPMTGYQYPPTNSQYYYPYQR